MGESKAHPQQEALENGEQAIGLRPWAHPPPNPTVTLTLERVKVPLGGAVTKYLMKNSLNQEGYNLAYCSRIQSIMAEKAL